MELIQQYLSFSSSNKSSQNSDLTQVYESNISCKQDSSIKLLDVDELSFSVSNLSMDYSNNNNNITQDRFNVQDYGQQNQFEVSNLALQNLSEDVNQNVIGKNIDENLKSISTLTNDESSNITNLMLQPVDNLSSENSKISNSSPQSLVEPEPLSRKERQRLRNFGKFYITETQKEVKARKCTALQNCKQNCKLNVTKRDQIQNFNSYWRQGSYVKRKLHLKSLISVQAKKRCVGNMGKVRRCTATYFLFTESGKVKVCKKCFQLTFGETKSFLENLVSILWNSTTGNPESDMRGKQTPINKTTVVKLNEVRNHIQKFPAYVSHYSRRHSSKKYLNSNLNIRKMYNLYSHEVKNPVSIQIYRREFMKTGLKFKKPIIDTCHKCDEFASKLKFESDEDRKQDILTMQKAHHEAADEAYDTKSKDKTIAKNSGGSTVVCSFDLQQCLATPFLQTSVSFYKRSLWTYNLTINNNTERKTTCYMWHEATANRGANEISSCLYQFLQNLSPDVSHLILYSDSCSGQNKNKIVSSMFSVAVSNHPNLKIIDHKFLVPCHTHMECDTDHSLIERAKKNSSIDIHSPEDWYELVRNVRIDNPFEVQVMDQSLIYNFEKLLKGPLRMRTKDTNNDKFLMQRVRWFRYTKEQGVVYFKQSLSENDAFRKLNLKRGTDMNITEDCFELCYERQLNITKEKRDDLMSLLPLLRPEVHQFYTNLRDDTTTNNFNFDPDIENYENSLYSEDEDVNKNATNINRKNKTTSLHNTKQAVKSKRSVEKTIFQPAENLRRSTRIAKKPKMTYTNEFVQDD